MINEGDQAPDFTLQSDAGADVTLSSLRGRPVVLVGRGETQAAFEAGAKPASPLVPAVLGLLLAVAQFFAVRFVDLASLR